MSQPSWMNAHTELTTYVMCHLVHTSLCRKLGWNYWLLTALFPSHWCHYVFQLSASPPIMQNGDFLIFFPLKKGILKIAGPFFTHIRMNPYSAKRGGKGVQQAFSYFRGSLVCQVLVGPFPLYYVYQFCPYDVCITRRYTIPHNMLKPEFWNNCKKLWNCFMSEQ